MWIPTKLSNLLGLNVETVKQLQIDLAAIRAERDLLKIQLAVTQNTLEWIRTRVNSLEYERAALLDKAYGVKTPVPELAHQAKMHPGMIERDFSFDHIDETTAKKLGIEGLIS